MLEALDRELRMAARVIGSPAYRSWRATICEEAGVRVTRVVALREGTRVDFGADPCQRIRVSRRVRPGTGLWSPAPP